MNDFKSEYNYLIFGLRCLFLILCVGLFFVFIFKAAPSFWTNNKSSFKVVGLFAGLFLTVFLPYRLTKLLLTERSNIILQGGQLILNDAITSKDNSIDKSDLKGFSTSIYQTKAWDFKTIILYLNNGDKLEFPQFLYWNFKEIKPTLEDNGIIYLGDEPYRWKWFDTRHYQFD